MPKKKKGPKKKESIYSIWEFNDHHIKDRYLPSLGWAITGVWVSFVYVTISRGGKSTCVILAIPSLIGPRLNKVKTNVFKYNKWNILTTSNRVILEN